MPFGPPRLAPTVTMAKIARLLTPTEEPMTLCTHTKANSPSSRAVMVFSFQGSKCYECGTVLRFNRKSFARAVLLAFGVPVVIGMLAQSTTVYAVCVPIAALFLSWWTNATELEHIRAVEPTQTAGP